MPEYPQMQALAERLDGHLRAKTLAGITILGFSGLKTAVPPYTSLIGQTVVGCGRRGKFLVVTFETGLRLLIHLFQAGRIDLEDVAKVTKPKGSIARFAFDDGSALLFREYGTQRGAGWWVLAAGDDGPLATLGPEPGSEAFAEVILSGTDGRRLHTLLRDQHLVAGLGRGHTDDLLHRALLSPFATLAGLTEEERGRLLRAIEEVIADALEEERIRSGGLSAARLGEGFLIHNRAGEPCPRCGTTLARVSYSSHEVVYCPTCQTKGRVLADRRLSRLLR